MQIPVKLLGKGGEIMKPPVEVAENFSVNSTSDVSSEITSRRKIMINSVAPEDPVDAFERYKGENDLLPINYLEIGFLRSRAVGRICYFDLEAGVPVVATGFLISPDLVMTNHHVFSDPSKFRDATIEFDYEFDVTGREKTKIVFELSTSKFFHAEASMDVAIVGVSGTDITGRHSIKERGYLILNGKFGKADLHDFASIIQHPDGKPMKVGLRENKITNIDDPVFLKYNTDTTYGSSGSAVFNDQWQLIALHSAGEAKKNGRGEYVDKDGEVIPIINGKADGTRVVWLDNRGARVSAILAYLSGDGALSNHQLIAALFSSTYTDAKQLAFLSLPQREQEAKPAQSEPLQVASPQQIYINILLNDGKLPSISMPVTPGVANVTEIGFEKKIEDEMDYSGCRGFDEYFMEEHVPMPKLSLKLAKKVAYLVDNPNLYVLKYYYYSTIQHAIRKMPVVSSINIWGKKRHEKLKGRNDKWFRDRRIDFDVQLTDAFYAYSGFDKGHMTRREDAEWGTPMAFAEKAANMTCSYTNACPQVPNLNRNNGDWGRIEDEILEKGVINESGPEGRICVFNGPIFDEEDQHFKGIQIPLRFFKIVVWRNPAGEMKTTAFILSQEKLVGDIEFELSYDTIFKKLQSSVANVEKLTGLNFTGIKEWDTFKPEVVGEEEKLIDPAGLEKLIKNA